MLNGLVKKLAIFIVSIALFLTFSIIYFEKIDKEKKEEFKMLSDGYLDYYIEGHHFKVSGEYLSPNLRYRSGKVTALWLEGQMPDLSPRIPDSDFNVNNNDPDRIKFKLLTKGVPGKLIVESQNVMIIANSKTELENGWTRYEEDLGGGSRTFLYYRKLGTLKISSMRCRQPREGRNPQCKIISNYNSELELNIGFLLSRWEDWEEIESKVRDKFDEFYIGMEDK